MIVLSILKMIDILYKKWGSGLSCITSIIRDKHLPNIHIKELLGEDLQTRSSLEEIIFILES